VHLDVAGPEPEAVRPLHRSEPEVADPVPVDVTECCQADAEVVVFLARVRVQDLDAVRPADPVHFLEERVPCSLDPRFDPPAEGRVTEREA
jgi:hypothetical protein